MGAAFGGEDSGGGRDVDAGQAQGEGAGQPQALATGATADSATTACAGSVSSSFCLADRRPSGVVHVPAVPADESAGLIAVIDLSVPWEAGPYKDSRPPTRTHHDLFPALQGLPLVGKWIIRLMELPPGLINEPLPVCPRQVTCGPLE
ncbi:hypothetical protein GCM10010390_91850 [Streptomyces mordarskii]|uniref:Uncharacterized protein n=1 Tax=Streptomyces mordarskii TaxID=1226758 RepID=A0ABN1EUL5_9ACTN